MIGSTLKQLLANRKMSVGELARRVQMPVQTLYSIIRRDNMKIDFDILLRICEELGVSVSVFCSKPDAADEPTSADWELLSRCRALDSHGRALVERIVDFEYERVHAESEREARPGRIIPLYLTPAAAGYASPALGEDYEDYTVAADCSADFAVKIAGDSMEPLLHDGGIALVRRAPIENGDVGMFFIDGDMKCKQYCRDNYGNVYLFSLNRARADADVTVPASSGVTLCCFGKVLLAHRPPLPV